jgi:hypothetical protein
VLPDPRKPDPAHRRSISRGYTRLLRNSAATLSDNGSRYVGGELLAQILSGDFNAAVLSQLATTQLPLCDHLERLR